MIMAARFEVLIIGLGLSWLGGPLAFYDLSEEEQIATLAYALVTSEAPDLHPGPLGWNGAAKLWNDAHAEHRRG